MGTLMEIKTVLDLFWVITAFLDLDVFFVCLYISLSLS